jgi:hypothetical protein
VDGQVGHYRKIPRDKESYEQSASLAVKSRGVEEMGHYIVEEMCGEEEKASGWIRRIPPIFNTKTNL